jgi:DNA polymerase-4
MIVHIDMDAFFAAVEQLDNPELKGQCVIIGSPSGRGVVATASYEARRFGVHSAMPMFMARKKCPHGIIIRPRKKRYKELSLIIMDLFREFTPLVEPVSIDEAYLDVTGCRRLNGSPEKTAQQIKAKVFDTVNLTCSVGIAPCKFLAKIASDMDKPGGLTFIRPEKALAFVKTLPIGKVPGVGKKTLAHLQKIGIKSLGDVHRYSDDMLQKKFGKFGHRLRDLSLCRDNSRVSPFSQAKSVSSETTLTEDTADKTKLQRHLLRQSEDIGRQLRKLAVRAKTITLKIKHADFRQFTRSVTLEAPTHSSETIYRAAVKLLTAYPLTTRIRLIGVGASGLGKKKGAMQMDLFKKRESPDDNWEKVDQAVDSIWKKFGDNTVKKASLHDNS